MFHLSGHDRDHDRDREQHLVGHGGAVGTVDVGADPGQVVQVAAAGVQMILEQGDQFLHGPGDPVGIVDHQGVARPQPFRRGIQLGPVTSGEGGLDHDLAADGERYEHARTGGSTTSCRRSAAVVSLKVATQVPDVSATTVREAPFTGSPSYLGGHHTGPRRLG